MLIMKKSIKALALVAAIGTYGISLPALADAELLAAIEATGVELSPALAELVEAAQGEATTVNAIAEVVASLSDGSAIQDVITAAISQIPAAAAMIVAAVTYARPGAASIVTRAAVAAAPAQAASIVAAAVASSPTQ